MTFTNGLGRFGPFVKGVRSLRNSGEIASLKLTASSPLKMDGWNTIHTTFLLGFGLFSGAFAVSFREGRSNWNPILKFVRILMFEDCRRSHDVDVQRWTWPCTKPCMADIFHIDKEARQGKMVWKLMPEVISASVSHIRSILSAFLRPNFQSGQLCFGF